MRRIGAWVALAAAAGCTVIVEKEVYGDGGGGGESPQRVVDALVLAPIHPSTPNLAPYYDDVIATLDSCLSEKNVEVRQVALAPLYRRVGENVPLLFGLGESSSDFSSFADALTHYASVDGDACLNDEPAADGENLAVLGEELEEKAIYQPHMAQPGSAYFQAPADGFVVLVISAVPRFCSVDDAACNIGGMDPAAYFTRTEEGVASWLRLPGNGGLPLSRIIHVAFVTEEGVDYSTFASRCREQPNIPMTLLDVMQPSAEVYFEALASGIEGQGGRAMVVDLCEALSSGGLTAMQRVASTIAASL